MAIGFLRRPRQDLSLHHSIGKAAFVLLLIHPVMLALRWLLENSNKALWYIFPVHRRLEVNFGSWALWGLVLLMLITLFIKLPYDKWKITHKLTGVFFLLSVLHIFLLDDFIAQNRAHTFYLALLSGLALLAILYSTIFFGWMVKMVYHILVFCYLFHQSQPSIYPQVTIM